MHPNTKYPLIVRTPPGVFVWGAGVNRGKGLNRALFTAMFGYQRIPEGI